ncbi:hypothetical protein D9M72_258420 [compost metagenome]
MLGHMDQEGRHQQRARPRAEPNAQHARLPGLQVARTLFQLAGLESDAPRSFQSQLPKRRQFVALADAVHQGHAKLRFQRLDAAA